MNVLLVFRAWGRNDVLKGNITRTLPTSCHPVRLFAMWRRKTLEPLSTQDPSVEREPEDLLVGKVLAARYEAIMFRVVKLLGGLLSPGAALHVIAALYITRTISMLSMIAEHLMMCEMMKRKTQTEESQPQRGRSRH